VSRQDPVGDYLARLQRTIGSMPRADIYDLIEVLREAYDSNHQIFIMGNGGSAATASHFACDLAKGTIQPGKARFRVICLTDNVPLATAWSNDTSYENIFAEQLANLIQVGDLVILISASGNSPNVLNAVELARSYAATTVALAGCGGGRLREIVDICVLVDSDQIEQVEDAHLAIEHVVCTCLREELRDESGVSGSRWRDQHEPTRSREDVGRIPVSARIVGVIAGPN
jgi:D-sedoheptulose 7-phosphate isomerase